MVDLAKAMNRRFSKDQIIRGVIEMAHWSDHKLILLEIELGDVRSRLRELRRRHEPKTRAEYLRRLADVDELLEREGKLANKWRHLVGAEIQRDREERERREAAAPQPAATS